jgi:hypothetical protein
LYRYNKAINGNFDNMYRRFLSAQGGKANKAGLHKLDP